jgi:hypothetical protein
MLRTLQSEQKQGSQGMFTRSVCQVMVGCPVADQELRLEFDIGDRRFLHANVTKSSGPGMSPAINLAVLVTTNISRMLHEYLPSPLRNVPLRQQ